MRALIDTLAANHTLTSAEFVRLLTEHTEADAQYLFERARAVREAVFGKAVYTRGLIEFTNYCKNNCYYCGIRCGNKKVVRYRLSKAEILDCCAWGYSIGFRTFVLQGGEDMAYSDDEMVGIISEIRRLYADCAITLSIGERSRSTYERFFAAGANRYLLRHETANADHYRQLHPRSLSHARRMQCLRDLKEIGFQTGTGFMVGSPYQTAAHLAEDLRFLHDFQPDMVGIGPFLPHHDTPFAQEAPGSVPLTLFLLGVIRLMLPQVLLPATTALGSADESGRERGLLAGANVIMPNLSPSGVREKYLLYDNKIRAGAETAEGYAELAKKVELVGYRLVVARGDARG